MVGNSKVRELKPGVYGPLPTFFDDRQELDLVSYKRHLLKILKTLLIQNSTGVYGLLRRSCSFGESFQSVPELSLEERTTIIRFIRKTLDDEGLQATPILAVQVPERQSNYLVQQQMPERKIQEAEGEKTELTPVSDAGMVILPAYYAASLNADQDQVIQYYVDICEASPVCSSEHLTIPLLLYNFPANAAGQDMSSAVIEAVMKKAPNLCGVKLTCGGSIGKLIRLNATLNDDPTINSSRPYPFLLLDGLIADLTPWVSSGGHGTVSGIPNFAPRATMKLWRLLSNPTPSKGEVFMNALKDVLELEAELVRLES
ncbi:Aldolase-type TIM barrel protein [Rutstroemia sp. NJR-2017a BVV2]|nr:Aldolase-type TIM barrel protein [Rutstroemia sp. NJR-2017a BVV2]PQE19729.1 Aldolase-type TIM barrel protein [Rutstroemia sp. NJR-2017a BVV2]